MIKLSPFHVVVIPKPEVKSQPEGISMEEGETVELSCAVKGFSNSTRVQWRKDTSLIDTTHSQVYHVTRSDLTETTFTETLRFSVSSETEGKYTCCVGYLTESLANLVTVDGVSEELECGVDDAEVSISASHGKEG
jgi:hypothetical protein